MQQSRFASPFRAGLLALLPASLAACNDSGSNDEPVVVAESANKQVAVADPLCDAVLAAGFVTLASELIGLGQLQLPANLVFRTAAEWRAAWRSRSQGTEPVPEVDFDKYMVIGIARRGSIRGSRICAGWSAGLPCQPGAELGVLLERRALVP